jgi:hypothetical protein
MAQYVKMTNPWGSGEETPENAGDDIASFDDMTRAKADGSELLSPNRVRSVDLPPHLRVMLAEIEQSGEGRKLARSRMKNAIR